MGQRETVAPFRKPDKVSSHSKLNILSHFRKIINCPISSHLKSPFLCCSIEPVQCHIHSRSLNEDMNWVLLCNWQYSPLRIYWNSPWVQARRSYGGFHLQISSLIYCYQLCCPSERKQGVYGFQCLLKDHARKGPVSHHLCRQCRRN